MIYPPLRIWPAVFCSLVFALSADCSTPVIERDPGSVTGTGHHAMLLAHRPDSGELEVNYKPKPEDPWVRHTFHCDETLAWYRRHEVSLSSLVGGQLALVFGQPSDDGSRFQVKRITMTQPELAQPEPSITTRILGELKKNSDGQWALVSEGSDIMLDIPTDVTIEIDEPLFDPPKFKRGDRCWVIRRGDRVLGVIVTPNP